MKRTLMLTIVLMFCTAGTGLGQRQVKTVALERGYFSQLSRYQEVDLARVQDNLARGLNSENDGVVESALAHATYMRIVLGGSDMPEIEKAIERLVIDGRTFDIRAKASLAVTVFAATERFAGLKGGHYSTPDDFFDSVASSVRPLL